jgi:hypothetical protein
LDEVTKTHLEGSEGAKKLSVTFGLIAQVTLYWKEKAVKL